MRRARILYRDRLAGWLTEDEDGYVFEYDADYLSRGGAEPVSLTLPLRAEPYKQNVLFAFFDGMAYTEIPVFNEYHIKHCKSFPGTFPLFQEKFSLINHPHPV